MHKPFAKYTKLICLLSTKNKTCAKQNSNCLQCIDTLLCYDFDDVVNIRRCLPFVSFLFVNFNKIIDLQPSGPIYLTEGDPIDIPCTLDDTEHYTIDDLELLYNRKSLPSEVIVIILLFINLYYSGRDRKKFWLRQKAFKFPLFEWLISFCLIEFVTLCFHLFRQSVMIQKCFVLKKHQ